MPKLFNYTFTFKCTATYTAASEEEALDKLYRDEDEVEVISCDTEEFENGDDYMDGR